MIPTKTQQKKGTYKLVGGIWHKLCTGPAHEKPEYLPATEKYFVFHKSGDRKGTPVSRCRLCRHWKILKNPGSHHGLVPVSQIHPFYVEIVNRIGLDELHKRSGISHNHILGVLDKRQTHARKENVRRIMLELVSAQR